MLGLAASALGGGAGGGAGGGGPISGPQDASSTDIITTVETTTNSDKSRVINIGAIMQPYNEGSLENGGIPLANNRYMPQYQPGSILSLANGVKKETNYYLIAGVAAVGLLAFMVMKKGRR